MAKVLGVCCVLDEPTVYADYWMRSILGEAQAAGHETYVLSGAQVTANGLLQALQNHLPDMVVLAGHGTASVFTGAGLQTVLKASDNDHIMKGSRGLFISCLTGLQLVPSMVRKGAIASQGYVKELIFMIDGSGNPAGDPYAYSFTRQLVEPTRAIMTGGSWQDWYRAFCRISDEEIARWNQSDSPAAPDVVYCLKSNKAAAVVSGAGTLTEETNGGVPRIPILPLIVAGAFVSGKVKL